MQAGQTGDDLVQQVRARDYDRFLAIQLAPRAARPALYAVTALTDELARIAETVKEPLIGHIRLAWWREGLEEITQGKPSRPHPLLQALAPFYCSHPGIFPLLLGMIEARAADFDPDLIQTEEAWRKYCDETIGALHRIWAALLGAGATLDQTVRRQAQGYALIGNLRAIPFGTSHVPPARMDAYGLTSLAPGTALSRFVEAVIHEAQPLLTQETTLPKPLRALTALARLHARALAKRSYDPYRYQPSKLAAVWRILLITTK